MKTRIIQSAVFTQAVVAVLAAVLLCGCQSKEKIRQNASAENGLDVRIDRTNNGAVAAPARPAESPVAAPRTLAFEMTGTGKLADEASATPEQRAAASQAAIVEALCKAIVETRKAKGQTEATFTVDFGPRLKVSRSAVDRGFEDRVTLVSRGVETVFIVRNGKLQHDAHGLRQVQQIFEATNGEFALLGSSWSAMKGESVATVAHYVPAELDSALAGSVPDEKTEKPADPGSGQ